jgi:glycosyltransferase involved in cell wall biosynthesis
LSSYCYELAHALAKNVLVEFISFKSIYPAFLYPGGNLAEDNTYPAISDQAINVRRRLTWYNPLSWILEGVSPRADLLHAQWWSMPLFPVYLTICTLFKLRKKPVVFTVHNVLSHDSSRLYKMLSGWLFQLGDHFIVHTETGRAQLKNHYHIPAKKISVIAHGSLDFHVKHRADPMQLRQKIGISQSAHVILLFGAIRPYKGVDIAIQAMEKIVNQFPEARLIIAGKLWEDWAPYDRLIREKNLSDNVLLYLEYIPSDQVHHFFEAADICVFPYHHFDSQSGAGATAVSFKKPMIVSNVGGLPELAGDKACIVEPNDPAALADKIICFFKDPSLRQRLTANMETVSRRLDWEDIAKKTMMVYKNIIKDINTAQAGKHRMP